MLTCCAEGETNAATTVVAEAGASTQSVAEAGAVGGVPSFPVATAVAVPSFAVGDAVAVSLHSKCQTCARGLIVNEPSRDMKRVVSIRHIFFLLKIPAVLKKFYISFGSKSANLES
jgi:hypothetical protein